MPPAKRPSPRRATGGKAPAKRSASKGSGSRGGGKPPRRYRASPQRALGFRLFLRRAVIACALALTLFFGWIYLTLPNIDDLNKSTRAPSVLVKSEDGQVIGSFGDIYGDYLAYEEMPRSLVDAVIATEDRNYMHHFGVDPLGLLRATYANVRARHVVQGGSTITQQVAKNVFLTPERSFVRKLREMLLAIKLERRFSKQEIMTIYLNRVYFGAGSYGVDAAARRYFDKSARDLTLSESAVMAGLLKAPSRYAPTSSLTRARQRGSQILLNMQDAGYLTESQTKKAQGELNKTINGKRQAAQSALYFSDWIMDQLPDLIGGVQEDLVVTTTLNPRWQGMAEKAVNEVMDKEAAAHDADQAALVAMSPDGAVRAMVGGRSYADSQYNRATQALRQPGSSFKLFVYLAGLEAGLTPSSMVEDKPIGIKVAGGTWHPKNYTGRYLGPITLKEAVAQSVNTVAVQTAQSAGLSKVVTMAHRLGVDADLDPLPSIALGATEVSLLEMTTAYAHLAADGAIVQPFGIARVQNAQGRTLYQRGNGKLGVALSQNIVGMMNDMLAGVIDSGTGRAAQIGRPEAGKTGTTSDYKDAWFMGYTPDLAAGVWVGNDDNTPMKKVTGGMLPARIWHDFMIAALESVPAHALPTTRGPAPLPWLSGDAANDGEQDFPGQPGTALERQPARKPIGRDVNLGPSFWDKLLR